uniref:mRNA decay activator protein ZFP36 n=1 Tax=Salarias fasciatus TaxID=181472 RepID=A0A672HZL5_SALFA
PPQTSGDDLFLPAGPEVELVDQLLSGLDGDGDGDGGSSGSLAKAFQPLPEPPRPPAVPWDCSTRYKTELCSSYSNSAACKYAEHCQFAHGLHELRAPFRHPKYKTELCRNFHATGYCYYGLRCLFVHGAAEQRPVVRRRRNVPCRNLRAFGVCPFGTRCLFQHGEGPDPDPPAAEKTPSGSRPKAAKTECQTFSTFGFCLHGTRCLFQHAVPRKPRPEPGRVSRLPSATSAGSSTSSSPPPCTPSPSPDATAHNAFTFSSRHLSELLLPLALQLQGLDGDGARGPPGWAGGAV